MNPLRTIAVLLLLTSAALAWAERFSDDFPASGLPRWSAAAGSVWTVTDGLLQSPCAGGWSGMLLCPLHARDAAVQVDVLLPAEGRRNVAVVLRHRQDGSAWVVRWYDRRQWLELNRYERESVVRVGPDRVHWQAASPAGSAPMAPGVWYTLKADTYADRVRAKVWRRGAEEPTWQLEAACTPSVDGAFGLSVDETSALFDNFMVSTGPDAPHLQRAAAEREEQLRERCETVHLHGVRPAAYFSARLAFSAAAGTPPTGELVLGAVDQENLTFLRAAGEALVLGQVDAGTERLLGRVPLPALEPGGAYELEAKVLPAARNERGPAWYTNADSMAPLLRVRARCHPVGLARGGWQLSAVVDPTQPGTYTATARGLGSLVGWVRRPGTAPTGLSTRKVALPRQAAPTVVEPVQRIHTGSRGGCWMALGDLDGDDRLDYVVARNRDQAVTALTAYANDGTEMWRWGEGDGPAISYDVPVTIYDIDRDGAAEVLCSIEGYLLVLEGATGREERRWALPEGLKVADCIVIGNLRGLQAPADLLIKTRYDHLWAYTNDFRPLWEYHGNTGHHPSVADTDGDGKDEVLIGFTLLDDDGHVLWSQDLPGHADATRLLSMETEGPVRALMSCCGGNDLTLASLEGDCLWRQRPAISDFHFQTANVGEIRPDIPGYEIVVDQGHAPSGRSWLAMIGADGRWLGAFCAGYPRHHGLLDWDGDGVMEIVIGTDNAVFDGNGRCVARIVGAPPFVRVADVLGDGRDEVILFGDDEIAVCQSPVTPERAIPRQPVVQEKHYNFTYY